MSNIQINDCVYNKKIVKNQPKDEIIHLLLKITKIKSV